MAFPKQFNHLGCTCSWPPGTSSILWGTVQCFRTRRQVSSPGSSFFLSTFDPSSLWRQSSNRYGPDGTPRSGRLSFVRTWLTSSGWPRRDLDIRPWRLRCRSTRRSVLFSVDLKLLLRGKWWATPGWRGKCLLRQSRGDQFMRVCLWTIIWTDRHSWEGSPQCPPHFGWLWVTASSGLPRKFSIGQDLGVSYRCHMF